MKVKQDIRLLRSDQVLAKLHSLGMDDLDIRWLDRMVYKGKIPFTKIGKFRRFREDVVNEVIGGWLAEAD